MAFLKSIKLSGFLSFPPDSAAIDLTPLNVLIGPNGSGKSNFIEAIELLRAAQQRSRRLSATVGEFKSGCGREIRVANRRRSKSSLMVRRSIPICGTASPLSHPASGRK